MSLHSSETSREFSEPVKETLTKAQKAVIDRVLLILETNPELNQKISDRFQKNLKDIVSDKGKFNLLLEKIGATEMTKLGEVEARFQKQEISNDEAISESKRIITHYTDMKLSVLK